MVHRVGSTRRGGIVQMAHRCVGSETWEQGTVRNSTSGAVSAATQGELERVAGLTADQAKEELPPLGSAECGHRLPPVPDRFRIKSESIGVP